MKGVVLPRGQAVVRRGRFVVHPRARSDEGAVPGWMVIAPARHVEQWDGLTAREARELGELIRTVAAALRRETGAVKVYVSVFAEVLAHLHVHVIARTAGVPRDRRGARIFLSAGADPAAADTLAKRVLARL